MFVAPEYQLTSVERRKAAFRSEMTRYQVQSENQAMFHVPTERAELALDKIVEFGSGSAVICWNNRTAYNLLHACQKRGIIVPRDLGVAGFDGFQDDKIPALQFVTVRCPWETVASTALDVLNDCVAGLENVPKEICLPVTLLPGDTV